MRSLEDGLFPAFSSEERELSRYLHAFLYSLSVVAAVEAISK